MNVGAVIFLVIICGCTLWLVIDTTIYVVRKIKEKKSKKTEIDENKTTNE